MAPEGLGEMGLELMMATREFGEDRMNELKSSKSESGEVERALFRERCAEFLGLTIEGKEEMSLIPEPRYGEREFRGGIKGDGFVSSRSVLLPDM